MRWCRRSSRASITVGPTSSRRRTSSLAPWAPPNFGDTMADDNCPVDANPSQANTDSVFEWTNTPNVPAGAIARADTTNAHQDQQGDACDNDDDNDGLPDVVEVGPPSCG